MIRLYIDYYDPTIDAWQFWTGAAPANDILIKAYLDADAKPGRPYTRDIGKQILLDYAHADRGVECGVIRHTAA